MTKGPIGFADRTLSEFHPPTHLLTYTVRYWISPSLATSAVRIVCGSGA